MNVTRPFRRSFRTRLKGVQTLAAASLILTAACADSVEAPMGPDTNGFEAPDPALAYVETQTGDGALVAATDVPDVTQFDVVTLGMLSVRSLLGGTGGLYTTFLMDSSGSVGSTGWAKTKIFVNDVMDSYRAALPQTSHFGVISFSNRVDIAWRFYNQQEPLSLIQSHVSSLPHINSTSSTRAAILAGIGEFASSAVQPWTRLMVVITDGALNPAAHQNPCDLEPALIANDITLLIVGISRDPNLLSCLLDNPDSKGDIVEVGGYNALADIQELIAGYIHPELSQVKVTATLTPGFELEPGAADYDAASRRLTWDAGTLTDTEAELPFGFRAVDRSVCGAATLLSNVTVSHVSPVSGGVFTTVLPDVTTTVDSCPVVLAVTAPSGAVEEGESFSAAAEVINLDGDALEAFVEYGDGSGVVVAEFDAEGSVVLDHVYRDNGVYSVTVSVRNNEMLVTDVGIVTVTNAPPTLDITASVDQQTGALTGTGTLTDPGVDDTHTAHVDYGDGSPAQSISVAHSTGTFALGHTYSAGGSFTVTVTLQDDDGAEVTRTAEVEYVPNSPPSVTASPAGALSGDEGSVISGIAQAADPDGDALTATVDFGDGSPTIDVPVDASGAIAYSHGYADDGAYVLTVTVSDGEYSASSTADVVIENVAPGVAIGSVAVTSSGQLLAQFSYQDVGPIDMLAATIDYGDGTTSSVSLASGSGVEGLGHTYGAAGEYTLTVVVTDDDGGQSADTRTVNIVLDRDGDGLSDDDDPFPDSNGAPTVSYDGSTSTVPNADLGDGSTMNDRINEACATARNHGQCVSAVTALANQWLSAGLITGRQKGEITSLVAKSKKGR